MKISDYVASFLAEEGVRHVFLLPGGGCMHLVDSFSREERIKYVACLHEQTAAVAADAYAQYRNNIGVALVTTGPGSTNAITGVAGSWVESVPLLILSGQVKTADIKKSPEMRMMGFQEVDIVEMVKPITKYAVTILNPAEIRYHLEKAVRIARSGRPGPVWVNIPLDVQAQQVEPNDLKPFITGELETSQSETTDILRKQVHKTIEILTKSKRPVIIAGYGIKISKSEKLFLEIITRLGIPVLTTWKACDLLPDDHPYFYGRPGVLAQRGANFIQQNCDYLIALGARLDFGQIGYASETFARAAKKVIVDIDIHELAKFKFVVDLSVNTQVNKFLEELDKQTQDYKFPDWLDWLEKCKTWKRSYPVVTDIQRSQIKFVSTYLLVESLSRAMNCNDLLVPGSSGACSDVCLQTFKVKKGQRILNSPGIGAMGFGLPQTIGACLASGGRRTVCVNGDGGFQLNIQDLETVRRLNLPIKYFILNNGGYASMRATHRNYFEGRLVASDESSGLTLPKIRRIADAYGIPNNQIANHGELDQCIAEALQSSGPFICEVMVDPEEQTAPKVKSVMGLNGQMVSKPQEDLAPFLDRKEFLENMIIPPMIDYKTI